jgi:ABC transporter substrate binding protein
MRRRAFIFALGSAPIIWSRTSFAQLPDRMRVIGWLSPGFPNDPVSQTFRAAFTSELSRVGWIEGQNLRIEVRWAFGDPERASALAKELVELRPDVIVAATSLSLGALARETGTIPILFVAVSDPIAQGYIKNLASPGGNITIAARQRCGVAAGGACAATGGDAGDWIHEEYVGRCVDACPRSATSRPE